MNIENENNQYGGDIDPETGNFIQKIEKDEVIENAETDVINEIGQERMEKTMKELLELKQEAMNDDESAALFIKNLADLKNIDPQKIENIDVPDEIFQRTLKYLELPHPNDDFFQFAAALKQISPEKANDISLSDSRLEKTMNISSDVDYARDSKNYSPLLYLASNLKKFDQILFENYMEKAKLEEQDWLNIREHIRQERNPDAFVNMTAWLKTVGPEKFKSLNLDNEQLAKIKSGFQKTDRKNIAYRFGTLEYGSNVSTIFSE